MSKTPKTITAADSDGMRDEYALNYSNARPNRFAGQMSRDVVAVVLDPDVASVFGSSDRVNTLLRSVISALPPKPRPVPARGHRRKAG